jgi:uncharacterized protein (DUF302 family)
MRKIIFLSFVSFLLLLPFAAPVQATDGLVVKPSIHSVGKTLDRLTAILKKKGIAVFARINLRAGAIKVGKKLRPTQVLIFGNPKLGTPLMQSARSIGIDLPMKVLAWQDKKGDVWVAYNDPAYLAKRHGIKNRDKLFKKMSGVLNKLTSKAASR